LRKDGFDPDQPRVPAGNSDGGQWTGEGGDDTGSLDPDASAGAGPPLHDFPQPGDGDEERVWERFPNPEFRNSLAVAEQTADKPNFGYGEVNARSGALGRYQMTKIALQAAGMMDANEAWIGKYGIHSATQFLANPEAQERALTDFLNDTERQLRRNGAVQYLGRTIYGQRAEFPVTMAGLVAAAHREGAPATRGYLKTAEGDGFHTNGQVLTPRELRIETPLRTFSGAPYE
jgi:hypothetical protein